MDIFQYLDKEHVEEKYCVNCKWYRYKDGAEYCFHPSVSRINVVNGKQTPRLAEFVRMPMDKCSVEGKLWEAKDGSSG